jgi:large subunit ribosomal protein L4
MRSALSSKTQDGVLYVVDELSFEKPSTKEAAKVLAALGIEGRVTIVVGNEDDSALLSFRNLPQARAITVSEANTYDIIDNAAVLITQPALARLEEVLV